MLGINFKNKEEIQDNNNIYEQELKDKYKYSFLNELQSSVKTDEEYAKFKGYID